MNEAVQGDRNGGFTRALRATGKAVPADARRHNRSLVLQSLFDDGPLSRADLARATHLTPTTTSDLIAGLLDEGLVEDVGRREVRGVGKPATLVGIVPDARHILTLQSPSVAQNWPMIDSPAPRGSMDGVTWTVPAVFAAGFCSGHRK